MTYRAKDLPAWVRFRPKPAPKPVYTVPTLREWQFAQMMRPWIERMARAELDYADWLLAATRETGPLRVRLSWD